MAEHFNLDGKNLLEVMRKAVVSGSITIDPSRLNPPQQDVLEVVRQLYNMGYEVTHQCVRLNEKYVFQLTFVDKEKYE